MRKKRRMARHQRKKHFLDFLSTRLLTVLISIVTSALMLCGIAIYAEVQANDPQEPVDDPIPAAETVAEPPSLAPEPPAPRVEPEASMPEQSGGESGDAEQEASMPEDSGGQQEIPESPAAEEQPENTEPGIAPNIIEHTPTPEPTEEPTPEPTEVPTPEPTEDPTAEPEATSTPVPTVPPVATNTPTPTEAPTTEPVTPAAYTITITPPEGWYRDTANAAIRVVDLNGTGWQSIHVRINGDGAWVDITDKFAASESAEMVISEDCTVYVSVTDPSGNAHTANQYIRCFDREIPVIRAAIDGDFLRAEGKDNLSGVAAIIVCGHRFTDLDNNVLRIRLQDYADNYEQVSIQAEDNVGNLSKIKTLKNPYYDPRIPTPSPQPTCTPKPTCPPQATSKPTATPKPTNSGGSSSGGSRAAPTPKPGATPTPNTWATATPVPSASLEPTASLGPTGTACLCETPCTCKTVCRCDMACLCGYTQEQLLAIEPGTGFSSTGNAVARDLLYDKHSNKQFIHMQTRDGASFYVVIDYDKPLDEDGESYETYFLNTVDARDLFDLVDEEDLPEQYQPTPTPMPTDVPMPTPEPTAVPPEATPEPEPEPEPESGGNMGMIGMVVLLLLGGGGALWYFKFKKPQGQSKKRTPYEDFDYEDDEDEDEYEDEDADSDE